MTISYQEVLKVFGDLLSGETDRDTASSWATELRMHEDDYNLIYTPQDKEDVIWQAILFLEGYDLKDSPNTYLHIEEDLVIALNKLKIQN